LQDAAYIDPFLEYNGRLGWNHSFKNRFFYLNNRNNASQSNRSAVYYSEYQVQKLIRAGWLKGFSVTGGVVHSLTRGSSELYKGNLPDSSGLNAFSSNRNIAGYIQLERRFFD